MPFNRSLYPANWPEISQAIRRRDCNRCRWCGAANGRPHPETGSKVILTVAHLDHTPANCDPANLVALCQRCHLNYDRPNHVRNAAANRRRRKIEAGQRKQKK